MNAKLKQDLMDFLQNELRNCDDEENPARANEIDDLLRRVKED